MFGLEWEIIAFMSVALIIGGIVKGVVALGLPIVTMAFTLNFMAPLTVLGMLVMPILVTNWWQTVRAGNVLQPLGRFWPMIVMALMFLFIGAELVVAIDTAVLFGMLGCFVVLFSATNLMKPRVHPLKPETEKWAGPLAGAFGGFLGGISTIWGPPMMMYFVMLKLEKDYFVRTVGLAWFSLAVPLTFAYWRNGVFFRRHYPAFPLRLHTGDDRHFHRRENPRQNRPGSLPQGDAGDLADHRLEPDPQGGILNPGERG